MLHARGVYLRCRVWKWDLRWNRHLHGKRRKLEYVEAQGFHLTSDSLVLKTCVFQALNIPR